MQTKPNPNDDSRKLNFVNPSLPNQHQALSGETKAISVRLPFTLTRQNGERVNYTPGYHKNVPIEDADHSWTKYHLQPDDEALPEPTSAPGSDQDLAARAAMQDEVARLKVNLLNGEEARKALVTERDGLQNELTLAQNTVAEQAAEIERLKTELATDDAETDTAATAADVGVRRKGRRWFVHRGDEVLGEFASKAEADVRANDLKALDGAGKYPA